MKEVRRRMRKRGEIYPMEIAIKVHRILFFGFNIYQHIKMYDIKLFTLSKLLIDMPQSSEIFEELQIKESDNS